MMYCSVLELQYSKAVIAIITQRPQKVCLCVCIHRCALYPGCTNCAHKICGHTLSTVGFIYHPQSENPVFSGNFSSLQFFKICFILRKSAGCKQTAVSQFPRHLFNHLAPCLQGEKYWERINKISVYILSHVLYSAIDSEGLILAYLKPLLPAENLTYSEQIYSGGYKW